MSDQPDVTPAEDQFIALTRSELADWGADIGKRQARRQTWLVAVTVALLTIAIAAVPCLFVLHSIRSNDRKSAQYDCGLVQVISGSLSDFIKSDAEVRIKQVHASITPRLLKDVGKIIRVSDLKRLEQTSLKSSTTAAYHWLNTDLPPLTRLARLDCPKAVDHATGVRSTSTTGTSTPATRTNTVATKTSR